MCTAMFCNSEPFYANLQRIKYQIPLLIYYRVLCLNVTMIQYDSKTVVYFLVIAQNSLYSEPDSQLPPNDVVISSAHSIDVISW